MDDLDKNRLEAVAELRRRGRKTAIFLRPGVSLNDLENALTPILPRISGASLSRE